MAHELAGQAESGVGVATGDRSTEKPRLGAVDDRVRVALRVADAQFVFDDDAAVEYRGGVAGGV